MIIDSSCGQSNRDVLVIGSSRRRCRTRCEHDATCDISSSTYLFIAKKMKTVRFICHKIWTNNWNNFSQLSLEHLSDIGTDNETSTWQTKKSKKPLKKMLTLCLHLLWIDFFQGHLLIVLDNFLPTRSINQSITTKDGSIKFFGARTPKTTEPMPHRRTSRSTGRRHRPIEARNQDASSDRILDQSHSWSIEFNFYRRNIVGRTDDWPHLPYEAVEEAYLAEPPLHGAVPVVLDGVVRPARAISTVSLVALESASAFFLKDHFSNFTALQRVLTISNWLIDILLLIIIINELIT